MEPNQPFYYRLNENPVERLAPVLDIDHIQDTLQQLRPYPIRRIEILDDIRDAIIACDDDSRDRHCERLMHVDPDLYRQVLSMKHEICITPNQPQKVPSHQRYTMGPPQHIPHPPPPQQPQFIPPRQPPQQRPMTTFVGYPFTDLPPPPPPVNLNNVSRHHRPRHRQKMHLPATPPKKPAPKKQPPPQPAHPQRLRQRHRIDALHDIRMDCLYSDEIHDLNKLDRAIREGDADEIDDICCKIQNDYPTKLENHYNLYEDLVAKHVCPPMEGRKVKKKRPEAKRTAAPRRKSKAKAKKRASAAKKKGGRGPKKERKKEGKEEGKEARKGTGGKHRGGGFGKDGIHEIHLEIRPFNVPNLPHLPFVTGGDGRRHRAEFRDYADYYDEDGYDDESGSYRRRKMVEYMDNGHFMKDQDDYEDMNGYDEYGYDDIGYYLYDDMDSGRYDYDGYDYGYYDESDYAALGTLDNDHILGGNSVLLLCISLIFNVVLFVAFIGLICCLCVINNRNKLIESKLRRNYHTRIPMDDDERSDYIQSI